MFSWVPNTLLFVDENNNELYYTKVNEKGNQKLNWYFLENLSDQICGIGSDIMAVADAHRIFAGYILLRIFIKYIGNIYNKVPL